MENRLLCGLLSFAVLATFGIPEVSCVVSSEYPTEVSDSLETFGYKVYREIVKTNQKGNIIFSPISLFDAFNMLSLGTDGDSFAQLQTALGVTDSNDALQLQSKINSDSDYYQLSLATRLFMDETFQLSKEFKSILSSNNLERPKRLNFHENPESCRERINSWVKKHTLNEIKELLPPGSVSSLTRMYIVNAVALKAGWSSEFDERFTQKQPFTVSPGVEVNVDMMSSSNQVCRLANQMAGERAGLGSTTIMAIPFRRYKLTFVVVMPNEAGNFATLDSNEGHDKLRASIGGLFSDRYYKCRIKMPKFKITYKPKNLNEIMKSLGATDVFDSDLADFSALTAEPNLFVSDTLHEAEIDVNELGVTATAATGIGISSRSMASTSVTIDKPFMFFIRHEESNSVLFMGRLVNPSS